jgi:hypothetical protein
LNSVIKVGCGGRLPRKCWTARPGDVLDALAQEGFQEFKREVVGRPRGARNLGGVWEGLESHSGSVASAVWVETEDPGDVQVFLSIDGERVADT